MKNRELTKEEQHQFGLLRLRSVSSMGFPYFAAMIYRLKARAVDDLGTIAIDQAGRIYIDFAKVEEWGLELSSNVLGKALYHWLRKHGERGERRPDKDAWITAAGWEVNDDFMKETRLLPREVDGTANEAYNDLTDRLHAIYEEQMVPSEDRVWPSRIHNGDTAETYYDWLENNPDPDDSSSGAGEGSDQQEDQQEPNEPQDNDQDDKEEEEENDQNDGEGDNDQPEGQKGSNPLTGSGVGKPEDWEEPADSKEVSGLSDSAQEGLRHQVAQAIIEQADKDRGSVPAGLLRDAQEILKPPVIPWTRYLSSHIRNAVNLKKGMTDFSYASPSRRFPDEDQIVFPSMVTPEPKVAVIIDTSGSMSRDDLGHALAQTQSLLRMLNVPVDVITADAEAYAPQRITSVKDIKLKGGGGTDMRVPINGVAKSHDIAVVLTDGYTPWPDKPVERLSVIACIIESNRYYGYQNPPAWIKTVKVSTEG